MGWVLICVVVEVDGLEVVVVIEQEGVDMFGDDVGELVGVGLFGVFVIDDFLVVFVKCDGVFDFIVLVVSFWFVELVVQVWIVYVIGIIGWMLDQEVFLKVVVWYVWFVKFGNMSFGVNLFVNFVKKVVVVLDIDFDIEVVEMYYWYKIDVFFGMVFLLGEVVVVGWGIDLVVYLVCSWDGIMDLCVIGDIGFVILCGGLVIGEYLVVFVGDGECIELIYWVEDRQLFVCGVVKVVCWVFDQKFGFYFMVDVFGLDI